MRPLLLFLCLLPGLCLCNEEVTRLIQVLGAGEFNERETAQKALEKLLPEARHQIKAHLLTEEDPEVAERLRSLRLHERVGVLMREETKPILGAFAESMKDEEFVYETGVAWRDASGTAKRFSELGMDHLLIDLRNDTFDWTEIVKAAQPKGSVIYISDEPIFKGQRGVQTANFEDHISLLIAELNRLFPKGAAIAYFGGPSKNPEKSQRGILVKEHLKETPHKIAHMPAYENWWAVGKAMDALVAKGAEFDATVCLSVNELHYLVVSNKRAKRKHPVIGLQGGNASLHLLQDGSVHAITMALDEDLGHAVVEVFRGEAMQNRVAPRLIRKEEAMTTILRARKLALLGRVAVQESEQRKRKSR